MADRPILFSPAMIRAILAGRKTQTRRLTGIADTSKIFDFVKVATDPTGRSVYEMRGEDRSFIHIPAGKNFVAPHYSPRIGIADRLYVREAWRVASAYDGHSPAKSHKGKPVLPDFAVIAYDADPLPDGVGKIRQAMHMPRWASRITLIVEDVRIERLQDISEADAIAEGIEGVIAPMAGRDVDVDGFYWPGGPSRMYRELWDQINGPGAWNQNPWVVAYTFRTVLQNIDRIAA